jgi:hypothetical protein
MIAEKMKSLHTNKNEDVDEGPDPRLLEKLNAPLHVSKNRFAIRGDYTFDSLIVPTTDASPKKKDRGINARRKYANGKELGPKIDEAELLESMNSLEKVDYNIKKFRKEYKLKM